MTGRLRLAEVIDCFFEAERCAGRCLRNFVDSPRQREDLLQAMNCLMMCHHRLLHCLLPLLRSAPRDWATLQLAQHLAQRGALLAEAGLAQLRELGHDGTISDHFGTTRRGTGTSLRRRTSSHRWRRRTRSSTGSFRRTTTRRRTTDSSRRSATRRRSTASSRRSSTGSLRHSTMSRVTSDSYGRSRSSRRTTGRTETTTTTGSAQLTRSRRRH